MGRLWPDLHYERPKQWKGFLSLAPQAPGIVDVIKIYYDRTLCAPICGKTNRVGYSVGLGSNCIACYTRIWVRVLGVLYAPSLLRGLRAGARIRVIQFTVMTHVNMPG